MRARWVFLEVYAMSFTRRALSGPYADMLDKSFGAKNSFWRFGEGFLLPIFFEDIAQQVLEAKVCEDDVWLISYPRTGSTWVQEIIWLLGNDFNFEAARKTIQQLRAPMLEMSTYFAQYENFMKDFGNSVELVNNWPSPRFIKTHLPTEFLPYDMNKVKPKIIYVTRHPKDLCVSYYHHCKMLHHMKITFEDFAELFLNDTVPLGSVFDHCLPFWKRRHDSNLLFLKYEDIQKDTRAGVKQIADFMGKTVSEEQMEKLCDFLSVDNMRNNSGCNMAPIMDSEIGEDCTKKKTGQSIIRNGISGDWKNYMSDEMSVRFDEWMERNLEGSDLSFN